MQTELLEVEDPDALAQLRAPRDGALASKYSFFTTFADDDGEWEQAATGGGALNGADVYKRWLRGKPELRCVPQQLPG